MRFIAIFFLLVPLHLGGCVEGPPEPTHPDAYCNLDRIIIYEYGDERINRDSVQNVITVIEPLFSKISAEYVQMPATESYTDFLQHLPDFERYTSTLSVAYADQWDPDNSANGQSWFGLVLLFPQEWRERTGAQWGPVPPDAGNENADPWAEYDRLVLLHEIGHELGLVNNGVPMTTPREHPSNPGHSNDPASPMYGEPRFTTEYIEAASTIHDFTAEDWDDLLSARAPGGVCYPFTATLPNN